MKDHNTMSHCEERIAHALELIAGRDDEQAFWDRAFCAALGGLLANPDDEVRAYASGTAVVIADAALTARRSRMKEEQTP